LGPPSAEHGGITAGVTDCADAGVVSSIRMPQTMLAVARLRHNTEANRLRKFLKLLFRLFASTASAFRKCDRVGNAVKGNREGE
jgi:hypothetical protein